MAVLAAAGAAMAALVVGLLAISWAIGRWIDTVCPPTGRFVDLPSGRLHYVDVGQGRPIVLVHGLAGSLGNYGQALLDALAGEYRLLAIDRSGSGHSPRRADADARLSRQAALVAEFITALGLERPLIVGHSLGGAIALAMALDRPDMVAGLALLAPLTAPEAGVPNAVGRLIRATAPLRRLLAWTVAVPVLFVARKVTVRGIFAPDAPPADFRRAGGGWLSCRPGAIDAAATDLIAIGTDMPALAARLNEITVPVAILFGTEDRVLDDRRHGSALAVRLPQLDFELVAGRGHMLPLTDPVRCSAFIRRAAARAFTSG